MNTAHPLVSILIPTYNRPGYFEEALKSALDQTYPNIEVLVSDDSTTDETEQLMQAYVERHSNIRYIRNKPRLGATLNFRTCFELARGEFINYLMDDDLFHPQKIERMMAMVARHSSVDIVTSARSIIDDQGVIGKRMLGLDTLLKEDVIVQGKDVANCCLKHVTNYIGEPTTALFRKDKLREPFGIFAGREYGCNSDMASWVALLVNGNLGFVNESLSYLRVHAGQQSQMSIMFVLGAADWLHQVKIARDYGLLEDKTDFATAVSKLTSYIGHILPRVASDNLGNQFAELDLLQNHMEVLQQLCSRSAA
jgi:glycosyltransferase involved in cell wall biosynthesis